MASKDSNSEGTSEQSDSGEDNFGLPDINPKPLDQPGDLSSSQEVTASHESAGAYSYSATPEPQESAARAEDASDSYEEPRSKAPIILGIGIVLVLLAAGYLIYNFVYKPRVEADRVKKEALAKEALQKKKQQEADALARQQEEERKRQEQLANVKPAVGTIEVLTGPTQRYYVVVSSDIDDDLLMDFAKKLSSKGVSTKIIPPFGGKKFSRLAIADYDSFASAQTNADASKGEYGTGVWVIRY